MNLTQRNLGIDALRVFSIVMVILGHAGTFDGSSLLALWRMPLFFILSGFFLVPYRRSLRGELARRWETLIIPYLTWSMVITLVLVALKWDNPTDLLHHLYTGWRGGTGRSVFWMSSWFLFTLALSAVIVRYLERFPRWVVWVIAIAGLVATRLLEYFRHIEVLDAHPFAELPLRLGISLPVIFYLLIGQEIRTRVMPVVQELSTTRASSIGAVLVIAPLVLAHHFSIAPHYIHAGRFGWPFITPGIAITVTVGFLMIFAALVNRILQQWQAAALIVGRLARTGSTVVLCHGLILLWTYALGFNSSSFTDLFIRFGITATAAFAVGLIINMTPAARTLAGVPQERLVRVATAA